MGIENFTHLHAISDTINDLTDYYLKSYTEQKSKEMLQRLGIDNSMVLSDEISNEIVRKLDFCLPYFLQIIFEKVKYLKDIEKYEDDKTIVDKAYNMLIEEKHFNTWIERINEQYNENSVYAFTILRQLCQRKEGVNRDFIIATIMASYTSLENVEEIVSLLIYMLKNDGYIIEENSVYYFRSPLLRDFWFNRYVK